jgi:calcineurin-like phosphoesterase family protein
MTAAILHLSDIHIKTARDPILGKAQAIAACIYSSLPLASHVFIVISGDIAFSGKAEEYALASRFLRDIESAIRIEKTIPISFVIAPGNHDCDFAACSSVRTMAIDSIDRSDCPAVDDEIIGQCTKVQLRFSSFVRRSKTSLIQTICFGAVAISKWRVRQSVSTASTFRGFQNSTRRLADCISRSKTTGRRNPNISMLAKLGLHGRRVENGSTSGL